MIKCLPVEIQGKLRSGVAIPSLQQCVEELILNSIDAEATCVGVRMDMEAFKVQVIDNGAGISLEDMENLGNRYCTSKCSTIEDLENLKWYGFRGEALASVVSLATLVEISSRIRSSVKTHVKIFKDGKGMKVFEAETARPSAGTTVIVCSFFHNMPVRRKRMDAILEGERIRHRVEAISLMHPSVSFTLKNDCTGAMMVQLSKAKNTYHRFVQIYGLGRAQKLGEISHTQGQFEVIGHIGREGHYNNSLQYLYVNDRLLLKTRIHKLLNFLLRRLSSSSKKSDSPDGQSAIKSPKHKRSQEQHGVYIINIKCSYSEYDICLEPAKTLIEFRDWDGILLCVEEAVKAFLSKENLVAELSQDDVDYLSPKLFGNHDTDQEGHESSNCGQETCSTSILDCSIGVKLASNPVHRKRKSDSVSEECVCQEDGTIDGKEETELRGQKQVAEDGLEKAEIEGNKEGDRPQCDLEKLELQSNFNVTEEEEPTSLEVQEGSEVLNMSSPIRKEENETQYNDTQQSNATSLCNMTSQHGNNHPLKPDLNSIGQVSSDCQDTEGLLQDSAGNRKISLCDPYIHESLQSAGQSKDSRSLIQQQDFVRKHKEKDFVSKRKISLSADHDTSFHKQCKDSVPSKIPRVVSSQKLSLCEEPGSLEEFRSMYGKSEKLKLPSQVTHQEDNTRLPETNSFLLYSQNFCVCKEGKEDDDATEKDKDETHSLTALSVHIKVKPNSEENKRKKSLASKLCHLKQHQADHSKAVLSRTSSQDNDGIQDSNSNENHCDTTQNAEQGCRTDSQLAEEEKATTSRDWLQHYDASIGKTVYVNKVTGLSRFEDPQTEEKQACCMSDVSNLAVNVVSETDGQEENFNSLTSFYSKWNNPVFVRPPTVALDISSGQADGLAVKVHNILFPYRFSKDMIHSMKVIHQVDKKFLACLISTKEEEQSALAETKGNLLVLVDQHAAHERVRLENLIADSYEDDPDSPGERRLCSSTILPPLEISVTEEELRLLRSCQSHLRSLGLELAFSDAADPLVLVGKVPLCFIEKESNELRRGRPSVIKPIVEEYLREQIELLCSAGRVRRTLPLTVLKVLASLACHGAIKFNDSLSRDECCSLVASLSSCQLPFQCAHGRPSIAPLVDILHLDKDQKELQKPNLRKLRRMYKAWQLYGDK
ncbi:DNA mismatch repair protein Mlh3 isoform X2 [Cheilinus undulatus]|uniref:DNA mismatch repair protein Mlh3 isoform X2 n=1 Tax=Cheilinus undulatus TaxID=241271 RepID=UPI001BD2CA0C|nr:DNA mismatch repair protein Mlh3 isoform X2 [Cheilinus undulatus]